MKCDQHNFVVAVSAKAESMTARMNEVFEAKLSLARYFLNNDYKFAIVSEDVVSNEQRLGTVCNLVISVIPKANGIIAAIDEGHALKTAMAKVIGDIGYRCMIADEDMMSDIAKAKIQYLPKDDGQYQATQLFERERKMKSSEKKIAVKEALEILENAQSKDFYTIKYQDALEVALDALREKLNPSAHWIFSGDEDDYDGYYMNCSKCGVQRKAYDRNYDLDVPVACPHCGVAMDLAAWEYDDSSNPENTYQVSVICNTGAVNRPYIIDVLARNEEEAATNGLIEVAKMLNADEKMRKKMRVDYAVRVDSVAK